MPEHKPLTDEELARIEGHRRVVIARLPAALVKAVDHCAIEWGTRRPQAMERLLKSAIDLILTEARGESEVVTLRAEKGWLMGEVTSRNAALANWGEESAKVQADLRALREAARPFATMVRLVGLEYGDEEWVVWIRGKDEKGEMREAGLQWLDLRRIAELMEGK